MHLALKSAMSRIPYTNKVGETLSSIADPAAAYSLRALGGGDPMVARVRRSSDDAEKDFTASDMDSGSVADWVNEDVVNYQSDFSSSSGTFLSSNSSWTYNNVNSWEYDAVSNSTLYKNVGLEPGKSHRITITASSASTEIRLYSHYLAQQTLFTNIPLNQKLTLSVGDNVFEGIVPNYLGTSTFLLFAYANGGAFNVSSIKVEQLTADGFVTSWYDQSGNDNDATQGTAASQPKIVDAGVLVSDGIKFDGVDDALTCSSLYSSDISIFNVATTSNTVNTNNYMRMIHLCDGSDSFQITRGGTTDIGKLISKNTAFQSGTTSFLHGDINGENLISAITSSTDTDAFVDGSLQSNGSTSLGSGNSATTTIGARDDLLNSSFFAGSYAEIIIYNSDQSANRAAIETNINNHYDIY